MSCKIQFNTGRKYTAQGQRIVAVLHDDNVVTFMDHDRLIAGEYKCTCPEAFGKASVLAKYDSGAYHMSCRAMTSEHAWTV